jgi:hypothetical protein
MTFPFTNKIKLYFVILLIGGIALAVSICCFFHLDWPNAQVESGHIRCKDRSSKSFTTYIVDGQGYNLADDYSFVRYNPKDPTDCCVIICSFPFAERIKASRILADLYKLRDLGK